jgi:MFS family permease
MELSSITNENAALIIGLIALPSFIVPLFAKPFIDKQPMRRILFITLLMMIISMVLLITIVSNTFFAILFILFYGLSIATQGVALNVLWPNYFGRKHLGSIRGLATVFMVIGSALGPLPFGISYDQTGNYNIAIIGMIILAIISASLALFIRKPHKSYDFS